MKGLPHSVIHTRVVACALLFAASAVLSCWAASLSLVKLPAADVWQHVELINKAASGQLDIAALWQKHNHLHFIPIPKLVYVLDILWFSGSGIFTALMSALATVLACLLFARLVLLTKPQDSSRYAIALLTASWLACVLQWESFVNPANLQWSGLSAGLLLLANGLPRQTPWLLAGFLLAVGCGAPWWLLAFALLWPALPEARRLSVLAAGIALALWEITNSFWLHQFTPLPLLLMQVAMPDADLAATQTAVFDAPWPFYARWLGNLARFITSFCLPAASQWLPDTWLTALALLPAGLLAVVLLQPSSRQPGVTFLILATGLLALSAGAVRAQLPGAYTGRFANTGLLFASSSFLLALLHCRHTRQAMLWWVSALAYTAVLAASCWQEAASIVHDSNQRRLSQVAYALDIQDARATSETPFAPAMELSFQEISERKGVLAANSIGIYNSREHRIFANPDQLPATETACDYRDIAVKPVRDDLSARKLLGETLSSHGDALSSLLVLDSHGQAIGYGIRQTTGESVAQQLASTPRWAGFVHRPADGLAVLIAYDHSQRCQAHSIVLP